MNCPANQRAARRELWLFTCCLVWACSAIFLSTSSLSAAEVDLVRVPLPIVGNVDQTVRRQINRLVAERPVDAAERPVLILEFVAEPNEDAAGSEFERSMALARFLSGGELQSVRTVAWLPAAVAGHAVLPVLACEEIVAHPDASLGAAGENEPRPSPAMIAFYSEIADLRRTVPVPVAVGMLDRREKILKAETGGGTRYLLASDLEAVKEETNVQSLKTLSQEGDLLTLSGNDLRLEHGFASHLAQDRRDLATKLNVPLASLQTNPVLDGDWRSVRLDLIGPMNVTSVDRMMRMIDDQILDDKNLLCFWIDSPGGDAEQSIRLAGHISSLDSETVRTIAFVEHQALSDASIVALACDDLVIQDGAVLGGPGAVSPTADVLEGIRRPLKQICKDQSIRWSLPLALVDRDQDVFRYALKGAAVEEFLGPEEVNELPEPDRWEQGAAITTPGKSLRLTSARAGEFGLAKHVVQDYSEFKRLYELENDPTLIAPSWASDFIDELAQPHIAAMLLFFAFFALMVELSSPGLGAGGFVSTLCFVVYFWSQYLHGTAGMLEVLLFMVGLAFIGVEIFVLPGFGLFGLGGAALMIGSLVLASQTFVIPQNAYQMQQLPRSLLTVLGGLSGLMIGILVLRKFLDRAPGFRRLMLSPPDEERREELAKRESLVDYSHLQNQAGVAKTRLVPSGKAQFGSELIDVVSEGQMVDKGASIEVVEVHGNRVVVRPSRDATGGRG